MPKAAVMPALSVQLEPGFGVVAAFAATKPLELKKVELKLKLSKQIFSQDSLD